MTDLKHKYGKNCIGYVIRILDEYTIIINVGTGTVAVGDQISVYEPSEPLYDLDGTEICNFEYVKDTLKVTNVNANYSVCKKEDFVTRTVSLAPILEQSYSERVPLHIDKSDIEEIPITDRKIRKGDPVKFA